MGMDWKLGRFHRSAGAVLTEIPGTGRSPHGQRLTKEEEANIGRPAILDTHPGLFLEQAGD